MHILNDITLLTCAFNNNLLTKCMIMSCFKQLHANIPVVIMDNSTRELCSDDLKSIFTVIDNSNFKLTPNYNQISKNHCSSIDYALKNCIKTRYVMLCDNDILFKPTISKLLTDATLCDFDCIGEIGYDIIPPNRLFPYFCIINVEKFNKMNLNYFDNSRCMKLLDDNWKILYNSINGAKGLYDTGYSFYEDIKSEWKIMKIKLTDYILHLKGAYLGKNYKDWLNQNRILFSNL